MKYTVTFNEEEGTGVIRLFSDYDELLTEDPVNVLGKEEIEQQAFNLEKQWLESQAAKVNEEALKEQERIARIDTIQILKVEFVGVRDVFKAK